MFISKFSMYITKPVRILTELKNNNHERPVHAEKAVMILNYSILIATLKEHYVIPLERPVDKSHGSLVWVSSHH